MTLDARTYVALYRLNTGAIRALGKDVTEDEARRRPDGRRNPFLWLLGHVAAYRAELTRKLGGAPSSSIDLLGLFGQDTQWRDAATYPTIGDLLDASVDLGAALTERLETLGGAAFEETTKTPGGIELPIPAFFHFHESYHVGQLGYVRAWLGKSPLVSPRRT